MVGALHGILKCFDAEAAVRHIDLSDIHAGIAAIILIDFLVSQPVKFSAARPAFPVQTVTLPICSRVRPG